MAVAQAVRAPRTGVLPKRSERPPLFVHAVRVYRTDMFFRSLVDLAVVGTLVLAVQADWSNFSKTFSQWAAQTSSSVPGASSPIEAGQFSRITGQGPGAETIAAIEKPRLDPEALRQAGTPLSAQLASVAKSLDENDVETAWGLVSVLDDRKPLVAYAKAVVTLRRPGIGRALEARRLLRRATTDAVYPAYILMGEILLKLVQLDENGRLPVAERVAIDDTDRVHPASRGELAAEAVKWWERAAAFGRPTGLRLLGMAKARGLAGTVDLVGAAAIWREAARNGDAISQFELARLLHGGVGVQADLDEAIRLYRLSAERLPLARAALATALSSKAVAGDTDAASEAMTHLEQLASLPVDRVTKAFAGYLLGQYHLQIAPAPLRSPERALFEFERSARLGSQSSAFAAAEAYRTGVGTVENGVCAYAYYRLARPLAHEKIDPLLVQLSRDLGTFRTALAQRVSVKLQALGAARPGVMPTSKASLDTEAKARQLSAADDERCPQFVQRLTVRAASRRTQQ